MLYQMITSNYKFESVLTETFITHLMQNTKASLARPTINCVSVVNAFSVYR